MQSTILLEDEERLCVLSFIENTGNICDRGKNSYVYVNIFPYAGILLCPYDYRFICSSTSMSSSREQSSTSL